MNLVDQAYIKAFSNTKSMAAISDDAVARKLRVDSAHGELPCRETQAKTGAHGLLVGPHFPSVDRNVSQSSDTIPDQHMVDKIKTRCGDDGKMASPGSLVMADRRFRPAWEVDHFCWPDVCRDLLASHIGDFTLSIDKIAVPCQSGDRVLVVVGERSGAGCTTVTLCLAQSLVAAGYSVVVVDADAARPDLAVRLEIETSVSWLDVMNQKLSLQESAVMGLQDQLTLLPLGKAVPSGKLSDFRRAAIQVMNEMACHYDVVLVDVGSAALDSLGLFSAECVQGLNVLGVYDLRLPSDSISRERVFGAKSALSFVGIAENFAA